MLNNPLDQRSVAITACGHERSQALRLSPVDVFIVQTSDEIGTNQHLLLVTVPVSGGQEDEPLPVAVSSSLNEESEELVLEVEEGEAGRGDLPPAPDTQ